MNQKDDVAIWLAFKSGDEQAFSFLFNTYYNNLYQYGIKISPDSDLIKGTIQELFIHLWESRERLGQAASVKFYLLKSLRRKLLRALRKQNKILTGDQLPENYEFEVVFSAENALMIEESDREQLQLLMRALNSLLPRQKEAIYLRLYNNLSYDEISELMGVHVQTARNYVHQALTEMRKRMLLCFSGLLARLIFELNAS